jgi:inhibitor of cysteine peptidase
MVSLNLTEGDDGKSIQAHPGDRIVLQLPENPTTGYQWQIAQAGDLLDPQGDSFVPAEPAGLGSGGIREFQFGCRAEGTARLDLKNWKAWEGDSSIARRFTVDIHIR